MIIKQKLPWVRPTLRKIDLTQEIIDRFPSSQTAGDIPAVREDNIDTVVGNRIRS